MQYRVLGCMSGSSMDGLDLAYVLLEENAGKWTFTLEACACKKFDDDWEKILQNITSLGAKELLLAHTAFGKYCGQKINEFIHEFQLDYKVHFIASHGHTVFHEPQKGMTFQMGDGAAIAAQTGLPVITDLRNMDVALGGQGAPIVPIAEKYLWSDCNYFLNLGGIANISYHDGEKILAFDVCPANRILNELAKEKNKYYDENGMMARNGKVHQELLEALNQLEYYKSKPPKSLANEFGLEKILPLIEQQNISVEDKLASYVEHIAWQIAQVCEAPGKMMLSGGGALNLFLVERIQFYLNKKEIEIFIPDENTINYKEAIAMALIGALRWREEITVLQSVTGAAKDSIGGALWMGRI